MNALQRYLAAILHRWRELLFAYTRERALVPIPVRRDPYIHPRIDGRGRS